jgi:hypothetical protein
MVSMATIGGFTNGHHWKPSLISSTMAIADHLRKR